MPKPLNILAFFDTRPGHQFQTRGVLSALSSLTDVSIRERHVGQNTEPHGAFHPDLLLGAGRRVHVPMLKAKIQTKARSVVLMRPTLWTFGYDLAVVPNHDRMKSHPKIIRTVLAPTTIQPTGHERSGRPLALVGGPSRHFSWDIHSLRDAMTQLDDGSGFDVITSRRTPPDTTGHLPAKLRSTRTIIGRPTALRILLGVRTTDLGDAGQRLNVGRCHHGWGCGPHGAHGTESQIQSRPGRCSARRHQHDQHGPVGRTPQRVQTRRQRNPFTFLSGAPR